MSTEPTPNNTPVVKTHFQDLNLAPPLLKAIEDLGFEHCSPIQAESLPYSLAGHDVLGKAQTGTGKTAAFLIRVIDDLLKNPITEERYAGEARALIVAPTRELVIQIAEDAKLLTKYTDLKIHTLVGGMDYQKQQNRLHNEFVDILVATPGRMLDFRERQDVHLDTVELLVIDEADRMLDMGFIPQMRQIVRYTPRKTHRQTLMFSATFTEEVMRLSEQWMHEAKHIEIASESVTTDNVEQHVYMVAGDEKFTLLYNLLNTHGFDSTMVFANRRDECRKLHDYLKAYGIKSGLLSGEIDQNKRVKTLDAFKSGKISVLVATDVAGRGIHINDVSHVVNYTLPEEPEDYVHRIGRTGRAGSKGISVSFACEDDSFRLPAIEELVGRKIHSEVPPEELLTSLPEPLTPLPVQQRRGGSSRHGGGHRQDGHRSGGRGHSSYRR
ncbi:ATP-dependent RNA helicase RhlB [Marinagarivorans algicola]|uniref:ATP-dependent RNA helicase RhlB n=1 Tax=Marinagarivorans algicola TaxID=1513270 RepID=UPI0006B4134A|nr:ATP-dependent RNA helicase RhlB [Marinagarivorans algicola]